MRRSILSACLALVLALTTVSSMPAFAATPITDTITNLNVPVGDNFLPVNGHTIPAGYSTLTVQLDLSNWQASDDIFVWASYSTDGGQTWTDQGGIETNGGTHLCRDGVTVCQPGFITGVPSGSNVMVRAHFIVPSRQRISGTLTLS